MAETSLSTASAKARLDPEGTVSEISGAVTSIHRALEGVNSIRTIMSGVRLLIEAPDDRRGPIDVRDLIESSLAVMAHEVRQKARLEKNLEEAPIVFGNAGQLSQLVVNLITNALDAMPEADPNRHVLTIRTMSSGGEAVIEVKDTGSGIAHDVGRRMFEPFFTTKPPGVGTGLGLSICHGIARSHGGSIEAHSEPELGSCFRVRLPAAHPVEVPVDVHKAVKPRLLIVEDDKRVAGALGRLLGIDYEPTLAGDGDSAMNLLEHVSPQPDIILCDFFLGATTGADLYERLRATHPELCDRMIFMTGAAFTAAARSFLGAVANPCLDKPFSLAEFTKALERLPSRLRGASSTRLRAAELDDLPVLSAGRASTRR
jgi:CheY-like chemotaxis protein